MRIKIALNYCYQRQTIVRSSRKSILKNYQRLVLIWRHRKLWWSKHSRSLRSSWISWCWLKLNILIKDSMKQTNNWNNFQERQRLFSSIPRTFWQNRKNKSRLLCEVWRFVILHTNLKNRMLYEWLCMIEEISFDRHSSLE